MKKISFILLPLLISFVCVCSNNNTSKNNIVNVSIDSTRSRVNEMFDNFFMDFCYEKKFQLNRIKFPLMHIHLNEELTERDTAYLQLKDWEYTNLGFEPIIESRYQVYDNFNHTLKDTNERVFAMYGIRDGVEMYYYFKRIDGLWYLVKYEDLST